MPSVAGTWEFRGFYTFTMYTCELFFLHTCFENKLHTCIINKVFAFQIEEIVKYNEFTVTEAGKTILFKEWELIVDEEDEVSLIN